MRLALNLLLYLSLVALGVYLYHFDFIRVPSSLDLGLVMVSFLFLCAGHMFHSMSWSDTLRLSGVHAGFRLAMVSTGLYIFMKYVPGKVMVLLGRAAYISQATGSRMVAVTAASFLNQIVSFWVSMMIGSLTLITDGIPVFWRVISGVGFLGLTASIWFYPSIIMGVNWLFTFLKRPLNLPLTSGIGHIRVLLSFVLNWISWALGFYLLLLAVPGTANVSPMVMFAFPLASVLSMLAIFSPGGLGVREGMLVACMVLYGIPADEAAGIAILSRLWFLAGEVFIFVLALLFRRVESTPLTKHA
jgi:uncharacterized membrane protein YbhN (UPF0104 family)